MFEGVVHLAQSDLEKDENLYDTFFEVAVTPPHDSPFGTGGDGQNKSVLAFCANDDRSGRTVCVESTTLKQYQQ